MKTYQLVAGIVTAALLTVVIMMHPAYSKRQKSSCQPEERGKSSTLTWKKDKQ